MNKFTDVINYWQELHTLEEARTHFAEVYFAA